MKTIHQLEAQCLWSRSDIADYLTRWNLWRKDGIGNMPTPRLLTSAIDAAIEALRRADATEVIQVREPPL
jgi:hypothetical protein